MISSNGRTWTVQSEGLSISTQSSGKGQHVKIFVGNPKTIVTTREETENKMRLDLDYEDGSKRWVTVKLDSPTKVGELTVNRQKDMLYIEGPM